MTQLNQLNVRNDLWLILDSMNDVREVEWYFLSDMIPVFIMSLCLAMSFLNVCQNRLQERASE